MNRHFGRATLCGLAMLAVVAGAEEKLAAPRKIPVEDFARAPDITGAQLSPDGKSLGYLFCHEDKLEMSFLDLATNRARYFNPGGWQMTAFHWVSNERVVVRAAGVGLWAVNRDTKKPVGLTGWLRREAVRSFDALYSTEMLSTPVENAECVLLLDRNTNYGEQFLYPDILEMDTLTGRYRQLLKNPGHVTSWLADAKGQVRFGIQWEKGVSRLIYRDAPDRPWQNSTDLGGRDHERWLLGLDASGRVLHVGQAAANGRRGIFVYDLERQQMGGALFEHEQYDVVMPDFEPYFAGVSLATPVYSHKTSELLGVRYVTTVPQQYWFDPAMAELQRQVDALHPELLNTIVSMDASENRLLVLSWSDREPGFYSLVDLATQKVTSIGRRMPWIKPDEMAPMYPIEFPARDGLPLRGYLTLPLGTGRRDLPAVLLVHGGPWVRDVWGFDSLVQFLANRGYAVLQVNFRGSAGYGADFSAKGREQIGGAIQDDITDATRWLVAQRIADQRRVAIMGGSFGGYSVLHALAKTPELYRCGIAFAAVTDWPDLLRKREKGENILAYAHWRKQIGDPKDEAARRRLTEVSPTSFADQIRAPLLLVHGEEDETVPIEQAKRLAGSLTKLGHAPDTLYLKRVGHALPVDKPARELLARVEAFLARQLSTETSDQPASQRP